MLVTKFCPFLRSKTFRLAAGNGEGQFAGIIGFDSTCITPVKITHAGIAIGFESNILVFPVADFRDIIKCGYLRFISFSFDGSFFGSLCNSIHIRLSLIHI